jgi:hypothetical protein
MKHAFLITALAAALPLAGAVALADPVAQAGHAHGDVTAFHGTAESLPDAILKVEGATGAKVVDIRFDDSSGIPGYHIVLDRGGTVAFMHLDAPTGRLVTIETTAVPRWMLSWRDRAELRAAETANVPLAQAIVTAERDDGNAPAVAAGIARSAANPQSDVHAYNVLIERGGQVDRKAVDSATNQVIADAGALSDYP